MSLQQLTDRLLAWDAGKPLPSTETMPFPRTTDQNRFVVVFVRMSGESSPWGIALGRPDQSPQFFTTPEPRNADLHAEFIERFAPLLLSHVGHPLYLPEDEHGHSAAQRLFPEALLRDRQLWVPGPTHLEMLHFLDFRYTLAKTGEPQRLKVIRALGRAVGWLFRESTRPGQVRVHDATARLQQVFTFPAEPAQQRHLGFLMAWLGQGNRDQRHQAALQAARAPVTITMLPTYEKQHLVSAVAAYNQATSNEQRVSTAQVIHELLVPELQRRWDLTVQALRVLEQDPRQDNSQLPPVVKLGLEECKFQYWQSEQSALQDNLSIEDRRELGSHPETDFSPARAAARYFHHLHAYELSSNELVHGDSILLERVMDGGDGFAGKIISVTHSRPDGHLRVQWTVESSMDDSLRLHEDSDVCMVGARKRSGKIIQLRTDPKRRIRLITIELSKGLTKAAIANIPNADDDGWVGQTVRFIDQGVVGISLKKGKSVKNDEGPGAWLTHAAPRPEVVSNTVIRPDLVNFVKSLQK